MQALYQWQMTGQSFAELRNQFTTDEGYPDVDAEYFGELLQGVVEAAPSSTRCSASGSTGPSRSSTRSSTPCC